MVGNFIDLSMHQTRPINRRTMLTLPWLGNAWAGHNAAPHTALVFPRDTGFHPDFQTEWWYLTGWLNDKAGITSHGFQITFFRRRIPSTQKLKSALAAKHLLFAHAAVTDLAGKTMLHAQTIARWSGLEWGTNRLETAGAQLLQTGIRIGGWSLSTQTHGLSARLFADNFSLDLQLLFSQDRLLQGMNGHSQKGPDASYWSKYYSVPHLNVQGHLRLQGQQYKAGPKSTAWLDHEWSHGFIPPPAVGWDWIGMNLEDGSALTLFQLRKPDGKALWHGGSFRKNNTLLIFKNDQITFKPLRQWTSPASGATYPVDWQIQTPAGLWVVKALLDPQELDSRATTGTIYWEGISAIYDDQNRIIGKGYLEMTGYAEPLRM